MNKKRISLSSLIDQIKLDFSEIEPGQAYCDCEEEHGTIEGDSSIWQLVEEAIAYSVEQTLDYLDGYEVEH